MDFKKGGVKFKFIEQGCSMGFFNDFTHDMDQTVGSHLHNCTNYKKIKVLFIALLALVTPTF